MANVIALKRIWINTWVSLNNKIPRQLFNTLMKRVYVYFHVDSSCSFLGAIAREDVSRYWIWPLYTSADTSSMSSYSLIRLVDRDPFRYHVDHLPWRMGHRFLPDRFASVSTLVCPSWVTFRGLSDTGSLTVGSVALVGIFWSCRRNNLRMNFLLRSISLTVQ